MFFIKHPFLVLTVFVTLTAPALSQAAEFTAEQKTEIGKIAEDYLPPIRKKWVKRYLSTWLIILSFWLPRAKTYAKASKRPRKK